MGPRVATLSQTPAGSLPDSNRGRHQRDTGATAYKGSPDSLMRFDGMAHGGGVMLRRAAISLIGCSLTVYSIPTCLHWSSVSFDFSPTTSRGY